MKKLFVISCLFFIIFRNFAGGYQYDTYTTEDGLPQEYIYTLAQDAHHFLWVGTGDGISRYNGKEFELIEWEEELVESFVTSSLVTSSKEVYFGHYHGAISYFDGHHFKVIQKADSTTSRINKIIEWKGYIWCLGQTSGVYQINKDHKTRHFKLPELGNQVARSLFFIEDHLGIITNQAIHIYKYGEKLEYSKSIELLKHQDVTCVWQSNNSSVLLGTDAHGLFNLSKTQDKWEVEKIIIDKKIQQASISCLLKDSENQLWVGTRKNGLFKVHLDIQNPIDSLPELFNLSHQFPSNHIHTLLEDTEGNIWVGSYGEGLIHMVRNTFKFYDLSSDHIVEEVRSIAGGENREFYVGTDKGVCVSKYYKDNYYIDSVLVQGVDVTSLLYEHDSLKNTSYLWIGTESQGLKCYDFQTKQIVNYYDGELLLAGDKISAITKTLDHSIWIAVHQKGIVQIIDRAEIGEILSTETGMLHNDVHCLYPASDGKLWMGVYHNGIAYYEKGKIHNISKQGNFHTVDVISITEDQQHRIWVGTQGNGVFMKKDSLWENWTVGEGLISNYCNSLSFDNDNWLWIGYRNGLNRMSLENLSLETYSKHDGLQEAEIYPNSILVDNYSNVWFGGRRGIKQIDLATLKNNRVDPKPQITQLKFFLKEEELKQYIDKTQSSGKTQRIVPKHLILPHDKNHLKFNFVSVFFQEKDAVFYTYKLEGFDKDWSPISKNTTATYTNLESGKYQLKIKASNNKDYWSKEYTSMFFKVQKPYWKKWWFYVLEIVFIIIVIFAASQTTKVYRSRKTIRLITYISLFIVFEFIHTVVEPYYEAYVGGVPIFKVGIALLLALVLYPLEKLFQKGISHSDEEMFD